MENSGSRISVFRTGGPALRKIILEDPLSLRKITDSGQCFRPVELGSGLYRFICGEHILYCRQDSLCELSVSCDEEEWEQRWRQYFDLDRSYAALCAPLLEPGGDPFLQEAICCGEGMRVLRQDPWEMLVSFTLSQRKSIPAIRTAVRLLCERYGERKHTAYEGEAVALFPAPEVLAQCSAEELGECGLGYRAAYVRDCAEKTCAGELLPERLEKLPDDALFEALCSVRGVGKKVANCVMLFGYGRSERVPSDVWMQRIVDRKYAGEEPFEHWGHAGLLQQYVFYYALEHKEELRGQEKGERK